ncbi:MAG: hypothetical protein EOO38_01345 [Cytophagaceae bacterium]|nr:MAG: hypothetical protein EOO38_01345 [Cytophagaceae bacterium]
MDEREAVSVIRQCIATTGQASGSKLARALRQIDPIWHPRQSGHKNLLGFITEHVKDVVVVGRAGMDILYAAGETSKASEASRSSSFWKTWVSPYSPDRLFVNPETGHVAQLPRSALRPKQLIALQAPDKNQHILIAKSFVLTHPELAPVLDEALSDEKLWWRRWFSAVRKHQQLSAWQSFRRQQLEQRLIASLGTVLPDVSARTRAMHAIMQSYETPLGAESHSMHPSARQQLLSLIDQLDDEGVNRIWIALEVLRSPRDSKAS